jgi:hypothetical protein
MKWSGRRRRRGGMLVVSRGRGHGNRRRAAKGVHEEKAKNREERGETRVEAKGSEMQYFVVFGFWLNFGLFPDI